MRSGAIFSNKGGLTLEPVAGGPRAVDQFGQRPLALQSAQARRVGRGDIDDEIIGQRSEAGHTQFVIGGGVDRIFILAEIDADDAWADAMPAVTGDEPAATAVHAIIVEAHAVDDGAVLDQAEQARARIAGLRARGDAADLDKAETQSQGAAIAFRILVKARGQADRVGKIELPQKLAQGGRGRSRRGRRQHAQEPHGQTVRFFGIAGEQCRPQQAVKRDR